MTNLRLFHSEFTSNMFLGKFPRRIQFPDLNDVFFYKFGVSIPRSTSASSFICHVFGIILCCTNPKMHWFYTGWIIATMKNTFSTRYASIIQNPRYSMCSDFIGKFIKTITIAVNRPFPNPTFISFKNILPEFFFITPWSTHMFILHILARGDH